MVFQTWCQAETWHTWLQGKKGKLEAAIYFSLIFHFILEYSIKSKGLQMQN